MEKTGYTGRWSPVIKYISIFGEINVLRVEAGNTEKQLLLRVAEGDETAFQTVYEHYKRSFYLSAYKLTRSSAVAEDIVQEVFITLWKKRAYLAKAPNPVGYLLTMLHHAIFYHFRKVDWEKTLKERLVHDAPGLGHNPVEELLLAKEHEALLQTILGTLTPQQQMVYRLSRQEGLSRDEIAQQLNISPNTVKVHLTATLNQLRTYLKKGASSLIWATIWAHL